jgi:sphingosine kinase
LSGLALVLTLLFLNPLNVPLPAFFDIHEKKKLRKKTNLYRPPMMKNHDKFLVLVNPNAGAGMGLLTFNEVVKPMLDAAHIKHDVVFTTGQGHAHNVCKEVGEGSRGFYDCVISCSGDGMLHECLNGLISGGESKASTKSPSKYNTRTVKRSLPPLAVVPVGSGNGVADSLYGRRCGPHAALEKIISGKPRDIDVMCMTYVGKPELGTIYDLHFFCWAVFSDHDHLTETTLRWMGPMIKMVLAPAIVLLRCTWYSGVLDFAPVETPKDLKKSYVNPKVREVKR